jgi:hypothetical protein
MFNAHFTANLPVQSKTKTSLSPADVTIGQLFLREFLTQDA